VLISTYYFLTCLQEHRLLTLFSSNWNGS